MGGNGSLARFWLSGGHYLAVSLCCLNGPLELSSGQKGVSQL